MFENSDFGSVGFGVNNNVYIEVIDKENSVVRQKVEIHNKATRRMVTGILRFLSGHFTDTNKNENPQYESAKNYIPCYVAFGDANIWYDDDGKPEIISGNTPYSKKIPRLIDTGWKQYVNYNSKKLEQEIANITDGQYDSREDITQVSCTYEDTATSDMDSIYFYCAVPGTSVCGTRKNGLLSRVSSLAR